MWDNEWITGDAGKGSVFFWDVNASEASIQEAYDRSNCPMDEIETRYGSWMKWGEVIVGVAGFMITFCRLQKWRTSGHKT